MDSERSIEVPAYKQETWGTEEESQDCEHIETVERAQNHGIPRSPLIDPNGFKSQRLIQREEIPHLDLNSNEEKPKGQVGVNHSNLFYLKEAMADRDFN